MENVEHSMCALLEVFEMCTLLEYYKSNQINYLIQYYCTITSLVFH